MKILLIHSHYQLRGGEDAIFAQERILLQADNEVETLVFINKPGWRGLLQFLSSVWNFSAIRSVKTCIQIFKPDMVHVHNWHYANGPGIIWITKRLGIPVVLTLHNYRLLCPSGSLMNGNTIFTDSIQSGFPWKAIQQKVFRNSVAQTFWLAFVVWFHKQIGTWQSVDRYLVPTEFAKNLFISSRLGIKSERFPIKPNFVQRPDLPSVNREPHFLFVGRLTDEKGVNVLLSAFKGLPCKLSIAGDGPLSELVSRISAVSSTIDYLGNLNKVAVTEIMQTCTALVFPSIWFEGMPMTIMEALSTGTPVIASNLGAMTSIIEHGVNGLHFEAGNVAMLRDTLIKWNDLPEVEKTAYRHRARETYERFYTPEANYKLLMGIYEEVIAEHSSSSSSSETELASNAVRMHVTTSN